ncbi:MAG: ATP-binding cassette domain-containing protein [Desulfotomaculaceae bacterium]
MVGLAGKEGRVPGALSGGERLWVAIARALLLDPELILADEPTGNLNTATGAEIISLLEQLVRQGKTVLVVSHNRRVAEACGKNIRMVDGRIMG